MIYLDYASTSPVHPAVVDAMQPYWTEKFGNPSSIHTVGQDARRALDQARCTIADLLGASPDEIIFTSGATESSNWAIQGLLKSGDHFITSSIEHTSVLATAQRWQNIGEALTIIPTDHNGFISPEHVADAIQPKTRLISIQAANSEVGTIQDFEAIGMIAHENDVLFHADIVQLAHFRKWNLSQQPIDLATIAPHKFGAPKGIGILYIRKGLTIGSLFTGSNQGYNIRPGTNNVAFSVAASVAFQLAMENLDNYTDHCISRRDQLIAGITTAIPSPLIKLMGDHTQSVPNIATFALKHLKANELLMHLDMAGIAASSGSACAVGNPEPSHVLKAMQLDDQWIEGTLRFSVGSSNSEQDIDYLIKTLPHIIEKLHNGR